jgi:DNA-binding IclR family transcriptional regulator
MVSPQPRPAYLIESVDSALRLLHMFLETDRVRISEAAAHLGVAPSTAHRLMAMLHYHGFVTQDRRTHEYRPGPDLLRIGLAAVTQLDLRQLARPVMEALVADINETVTLGLLQGGSVLYVDAVESTQVLRIGARTGALIPLHCVSLGKALLAALPPADVDVLYPGEDLHVMTARTVSTKTELRKQLALVRKRGFAESRGESEDGVASIAAAVTDARGLVRGALSVAAPASRFTQERIAEWAPRLRRAVDELGERCR